MEKEIAAYLAGIIDGEGSITFANNGKGRWPCLAIDVTSCDVELIDWLHSEFGGTKRTRKSTNPLWNDAYVWRVKKASAVRLLMEIQPYLRITKKKVRADIAIRWGSIDGRKDKKTKLAVYQEFLDLPVCRGK